MDRITEHALLTDAIAAAQEIGLDINLTPVEPQTTEWGADAQLRLRCGDQEVQYLAKVKRGLRPTTLGATLLQLERLGEQALLIADYVSPPLSEELRAQGVPFLDTAGNAYLNHPPVLVWVKGQRPAEKPAAATAGRVFQPGGLQVVFTLLCKTGLAGQSYREIARLAGVAHGTVGIVMTELQREGFILDLGRQGRSLRQASRLLDIWVEAYARTLRPKLLLGRYRAPANDWWQDLDVTAYDALLGAEPAAARLDGYLRPGIATLYAETLPSRLLADQRLRRDPEGDVEIRKRFWAHELIGDKPGLVPTLLIYADLLATGEARCIEAAKRIHDAYLNEFFGQS